MMAIQVSADSRDQYIQQLEATAEMFAERMAELEFQKEDAGWIQLNGDSNYEFSKTFLNRIVARSRLYFIQNPLINRAVNLQADYVFAQGVNIQGTNELVNNVVQKFIDDVQNKSEFTAHAARLLKEQTLLIDGNIFFVLFTDKAKTGKVSVRSLLIDEITDIITNPDDAGEVWFYKREWFSKSIDGSQSKQNVAYYPDIDYMPAKKLAGLPKTRGKIQIYWDAPILHVKTGMLAKSRYGIPETYSALDWAKTHSKMLANWATIIAMFAQYAFKMTTAGDGKSVVAAKNRLQTSLASGQPVERNDPTTTGGIFIKKAGVDLEPVKTNGATTSAEDSRQIRLMVASAMGLPDPMLSGEVDVGNLATAKTLDRPTELKFRSRQQLWTDITQRIISWVIRWSIEAPNGALNKVVNRTLDNDGTVVYKPKNDPKTGKPIDLHIEVSFPPILERTVQERIDAVIGAVTLNGKTFAVDSPELKKITIRLMLQALGLNDVDELVDVIFSELTNNDLKDTTPADPNKPVVDPNKQDVSTQDNNNDPKVS